MPVSPGDRRKPRFDLPHRLAPRLRKGGRDSIMNTKLASLCLRLWILGFLGMWVAKGIFDRGPGEAGFDLCSVLWISGGLTYALLGALCTLESGSARSGA
jgi:hypothetical protein